jgi:tripartite motif-containing protein 71
VSAVCRLFLSLVLVAVAGVAAAPAAYGSYIFDSQFGTAPPADGEFQSVYDVAAGPGGVSYVTDSALNRVQKFDANGAFLGKWGSKGTGNGQFDAANSVAVDSSGSVYVADYNNNRIQKFDASGTFVTKWGGPGSGDGKFFGPTGVAVSPAGSVYVSDLSNHRVQKFDANGTFLTKWGSDGSGNDQFLGPEGIAVDAAGSVYVADRYATIKKFDANGVFQTSWSTSYRDISARPGGGVYVLDGSAVKAFDSSGAAAGSWAASGFGLGVAANGDVYLVTQPAPLVKRLSSTGSLIAQWGTTWGTADGQFLGPSSIALDPAGNAYVNDVNDRMQKFGPDGSFILKWGGSGTGDGQFDVPTSVAVSPSGEVYVTDRNYRVQVFDTAGNFLRKWGSHGGQPGQFEYATWLALDAAGNVYVSDQFNARIEKFDSNGTFLTQWGGYGSGSGRFQYQQYIAISPQGFVYVADVNNNLIQKFDLGGHFIRQWTVPGVTGLVTDSAGYLYVSVSTAMRKYDPDGNLVTQWGSAGSAAGQFQNAAGAAVDPAGDVFVADTGNRRIQRFRVSGGYPRPKGATPFYASLVPAFHACTTPTAVHAPPLNFGSCAPSPTSAYLTVGTPDANGEVANAVGSVRFRVIAGNPATPADEADVELAVAVSDVRRQSGLSDYPGELRVEAATRITDNASGASADRPATVQDLTLPVTVPCASTPDAGIGSSCVATTTLDAVTPGAVTEGKRSVWQLGHLQVFDGGPDDSAGTTAGDTLFMTQGVFAP